MSQLCLEVGGGAGWSCQATPKPWLFKIPTHYPSLPLSRYGAPSLQSFGRANPSRKPGRPPFPLFPRHLLGGPLTSCPCVPRALGVSVSAVGMELATHCPTGYGANTGWASVEFTNSTLPQPQCRVHQGHTTCHQANGPSDRLPAFALLSKLEALAPPRSWRRGGKWANDEGDTDPRPHRKPDWSQPPVPTTALAFLQA